MAGPTTPPVGSRYSTGEDISLLRGPTTAPGGSVVVTPGVSSDLNTITQANPAGTTFYLLAGRHILGGNSPGQFSSILPKVGNTYIGAPGAVLDGRGISSSAFAGSVTGIRIAYLEIINFRSEVNQMVINHDGGHDWTYEYCHIHHNWGAAIGATSGMVLRYCWIHHNSQYAFSSIGAAVNEGEPCAITNMQIHHNEIAYNGDQRDEIMADGSGNPTGGGRNGGCKFWDTAVVDMYNNWIHDQYSTGIWADTNNVDFRIENNLIEDNYGWAVIYEISYNVLIKDNMIRGNAVRMGLRWNYNGDNFPIAAIYMSESGSEPRLTQYRYNTASEITGNTFINNMNDIALWENADRFCNSPGNTSNAIWKPKGGIASLAVCNAPSTRTLTVNLVSGSPDFTIVSGTFRKEDEGQFISGTGIPASTRIMPETAANNLLGGYEIFPVGSGRGTKGRMTANATQTVQSVLTLAAGSINSEPALTDCRWMTQNVHIHDNLFQHNQSEVLGARNTLTSGVRSGKHSVLSNSGYGPIVWWGSPYTGNIIKDRITYTKGNIWSNNTYQGSAYNWQPWDTGGNANWTQWRAAPYNQDVGSTLSTTDPVTGFPNTKNYRCDPPTSVTAVAGNGQARITFPPCPDTGNDQIVGYTVTASPSGATASERGSPIIISGLTNGTAYTFTVKSRSSIGLSSASPVSNSITPSAGASISTARQPWQPTELTAHTGISGETIVSFLDPIDVGTSAVTGYTVTASPGGATASNTISPVTFPSLPNGTYTFTATATSAAGTSPSAYPSAPFVVGGTVSPPAGLGCFVRVNGVTSAVVQIWEKNSAGTVSPILGRTE